MLDEKGFLAKLQERGALRVSRVTFRANRTIVWSLTQGGRVLNLHAAFAEAPSGELLDALATLAREGGVGSAASRRAAAVVGAWPALGPALAEARGKRRTRSGSACCATFEQSRYLRALYRYFNRTRFDGRLPEDLPVRLSGRMRSALGHMLPGPDEGPERRVAEIALNVDLMLEGNGAERIDTLLHEMAHVADYLLSGHRGHGKSWRDWARRAGCRPERLYDRPVRRRRRRAVVVTRVPPLPPALGSL
ncbi:MAG: SprT family zinc-dependent metalloprotease [Gemmatimonadales bacterium]